MDGVQPAPGVTVLSESREERVLAWLDERFDRALLVLGDSTEPLRPHTRRWMLAGPGSGAILGVAARFEGFGFPVVALAADDARAADALLRIACGGAAAVVAVSAAQPLPRTLEPAPRDRDLWLAAPPPAPEPAPEGVERLEDAALLQAFYAKQGVAFWTPAMLRAGPAFGVRGRDGSLVCAGGVNFLLPSHSYAQIGALATDPAHRGRGYACRVLAALRSALGEAGIACGLFAEAANGDLQEFYARRGFSRRGEFLFIQHDPAPGGRRAPGAFPTPSVTR